MNTSHETSTRRRVAAVWLACWLLPLGGSALLPAAELRFAAGSTNGMTNTVAVVPVRVADFTGISSFQFSLHWDPAIASFAGLEQLGLPGMSPNENFGTRLVSNGTLTVSWEDRDGTSKTVPNGTIIFAVRLLLVGPPAASSAITIDGNPTAIEAADETLTRVPVTTANGVLDIDQTLVVTCAGDKNVQCGAAWNFDPPVPTDSCFGSAVRINVLSTVTNVMACGTTATRIWELLDGCNNRLTCTQVVRIVDTVPPVATCAPNKTVELGTPWNFDPPSGTDVCSGGNLTLRIVSTVTNTSGFCGNTFSATRTWELADSCSNKVTCAQTVTVRDTTPPTITCAPNKTVNCRFPWSFDTPTAVDVASGPNVMITIVSTTTNGTCGSGFTATRTWRATDSCGNSSTCSQTVSGRAVVTVSGTVFSPTNHPTPITDRRLAGAILVGPGGSNAVTTTDGSYALTFDAASNVLVTPLPPPAGNPSDGVTTLDISLLRRHVLNVANLDSPYRLLAADVDGSATVSTLDLSFIRRLVLGVTNRFPLGLWRFLPADHTFPNTNAPWGAPTNRSYASVNVDVPGQDFLGLKLGDANSSWTPSGAPDAAKNQSPAKGGGGAVTFVLPFANALPEAEVNVPVRVRNFTNVNTLQFSLHWNPASAAFAGIDQFGLPGMSLSGNFNVAMSNAGVVTVSWDEPNGGMAHLADNSVIFNLRLRIAMSASGTSSLTLDGSPTAFEVTDGTRVLPAGVVPGQLAIQQTNRPPVLGAVGNRTLNEGSALQFTATVTDPDAGQAHTFSLAPGAPAGASIHPTSGAFTWTPSEAQGPGTFEVTVRVADNGAPALSDSETISITVNEVNAPPMLGPIGSRNATVGNRHTFQATASDRDLPAQSLAFSLDPGAPAGASISAGGAFAWTPAARGTHTVTVRVTDNGTPPLSVAETITIVAEEVVVPIAVTINDVTVPGGVAGMLDAAFDVNLSAPAAVDVSVDFMTADGSAIAGTDYMATNGTLVFPAGTTNLQLHVTVNGDPAAQVDRTFSVNLSNPTNAVIEDGEGVATIVNDSAPSLSIDDISFVEGNAGRSNALFTVTLSRPSDRLVTVRYVTVRDTATSRRDFKPRRGTVRIPAGETRATIAVPIVGETLSEEDEQFAVRLSRSVNAVIADDQGICTIVDDDAFPEITISDAAGVEADAGARNFIFAVQLSAKSGRTVTVDFASADGTAAAGVDYTPVSGTLVFPPGTTAQRIVVSVLGNRVSEENKTFFVNLRNPVNATIADGQGLGSVRDNDRDPALSIDDVTIEEGGVGKTIATFQLRLSAPSGKPVSVSFATADGSAVAGSDFLGTNGVVEIPPGTVEVGLPMIVLGNVATGPNRSFTVELSAPVHATLARARGVCTIKDDDVEAPTLAAAALSKSASGQLMQKASADALPITVITPPANQTACVGATIVFSVQAEGDDIQYQWLKGSSTLAGQTSRTLVLPNVTAASAGTYRVRLTGPENTVTVSATLVVQTPVSATPLPNLVRALGSIAVFRTTPSGTGPFTYEWWHGDRLIEGQTSSSLTLSNLALHQSGTYRVVVGGECGTVTQSATLEVAPCFQNVDVMLVIDRSGSMDGQPYREALRASTNFARNLHLSTNGDLIGLVSYNPTSTLDHVLTTNRLSLERAIDRLPDAARGTCISCGILTAQAELESSRHRAEALPVMVLLSDGLPHDFDTPSNALYSANLAKHAGTRIFTVGLGDVDHVLMSQMASSPGDYFYATNTAQISALFDAIATVICRAPTNIMGPSDVIVCEGENVNLHVSATGCESFAFQWHRNGAPLNGQTGSSLALPAVTSADAGIYSVVVASPCRTVTNHALVTVNAPVQIVSAPGAVTGCSGGTVVLDVAAIGSGLTYQWFKGAEALPGETARALTLHNLSAADGGAYHCVVRGACGTPAMASASLAVAPVPEITCVPGKVVAEGAPWAFDAPRANHPITVFSTVTNGVGTCEEPIVITRTWRATDLCGNYAECSQSVTFQDLTAPAAVIVSPTNGTVLLQDQPFTIVADVVDVGGVSEVKFLAGDQLLHVAHEAPFFCVASNIASGPVELRIVATDRCGLATTSVLVSIEIVTTNAVRAVGQIVLNRQNGLFEHFVTVSNHSSQVWENGVRLSVLNVPSHTRVWNATGTNGVPYLDVPAPLAPGEITRVLVQYYAPNPRVAPHPTLVAVPLPAVTAVLSAPPVRVAGRSDSAVVLEFPTVRGRHYYLQCSADLRRWNTLPGVVCGTGGTVQCTNKATVTREFFRVLAVP